MAGLGSELDDGSAHRAEPEDADGMGDVRVHQRSPLRESS
jgi:hypothetical protein